jgi:hypothetical protein
MIRLTNENVFSAYDGMCIIVKNGTSNDVYFYKG